MGAPTEVSQIYSHPQTAGITHLGCTRAQRCQCLLWYLGEHSRAGCSQAAAPATRSQGAHLDPSRRLSRVGSACGILALEPRLGGAPAH